MGKNYKYKFATKEDNQFNDFLNKTIIGTSYNFFNEWKEQRETISFEEKLSGEEIAKKIKINKNSVYRMRKRTLGKLKKIIMEEQKKWKK